MHIRAYICTIFFSNILFTLLCPFFFHSTISSRLFHISTYISTSYLMSGIMSTQNALVVFIKCRAKYGYFLASFSSYTFPRENRYLVFCSLNPLNYLTHVGTFLSVSFALECIRYPLTQACLQVLFLQIPVFLDSSCFFTLHPPSTHILLKAIFLFWSHIGVERCIHKYV